VFLENEGSSTGAETDVAVPLALTREGACRIAHLAINSFSDNAASIPNSEYPKAKSLCLLFREVED